MPETPLYKAARVFIANVDPEEIAADADMTNLRLAVDEEAEHERARRILAKTEGGKLTFERTGADKDRFAVAALAFGTENEKRVILPGEVLEVYMEGPWIMFTVRKR